MSSNLEWTVHPASLLAPPTNARKQGATPLTRPPPTLASPHWTESSRLRCVRILWKVLDANEVVGVTSLMDCTNCVKTLTRFQKSTSKRSVSSRRTTTAFHTATIRLLCVVYWKSQAFASSDLTAGLPMVRSSWGIHMTRCHTKLSSKTRLLAWLTWMHSWLNLHLKLRQQSAKSWEKNKAELLLRGRLTQLQR